MTLQYLLGALVAVLIIAAIAGLIALGWRNRKRRQSHVPAPAQVPQSLATPRADFEGMYVVTTSAGNRSDRIAAHDLGVRGEAVLSVGADGVAVLRRGEPDFFIPAAELELVGTTNAMVGKSVESGGIVVLRHHHDGFGFDTGFRARYRAEQPELLDTLNELAPLADDAQDSVRARRSQRKDAQ